MGNKMELSFGWSLKPITVLMVFFGQEIVIDKTKPKGKFYSFLIFLIGGAILMANIVINTMSFISIYIVYRRRSIPDYVNFVIGHLFHDLVVVGIPLSFTAMRVWSCCLPWNLFNLTWIFQKNIIEKSDIVLLYRYSSLYLLVFKKVTQKDISLLD